MDAIPACSDNPSTRGPVEHGISVTSRLPVERKSSVCVICRKYRILILISIISSLGQILLSYTANTSLSHTRTHARTRTHTRTHARTNTHTCTHTRVRTHARMHARARTRARTHTHRRRRSGCCCSMGRWRPTVTQLTPLFDGCGDQWPVAGSFKYTLPRATRFREFWVFFA